MVQETGPTACVELGSWPGDHAGLAQVLARCADRENVRASRAYIAGLGTTTVLVAGAVLLLVVLSALFAFRGWSAGAAGEKIAALIVGDPSEPRRLEQAPPRALRGPAAVAAPPSPARRRPATVGRRAKTPAAGGESQGGGTGTTGGDGGPPRDQRTGSGGADVEIAPPTVGAPDPPFERAPAVPVPRSPRRPDGLSGLSGGVGDLTEGLTGGLGQTVGGLNPRLGGTITDLGQGVSDLVGGLGASG